jgi:CRISPR-associated protein (TIGR02584 family)
MTTVSRIDAAYKQRVLIVLVGMSPAVLTETIWALATLDESERFIPTCVKVITTGAGKRKLIDQVLTPKPWRTGSASVFDRLCAQPIGLPRLPFAEGDILVPQDGEGSEYKDAHAAPELEAMSDLILETVRGYTGSPETVVYVSLAGGRKSMAHYAGQVMTAVGRPQDRLLHVIVTPSRLERCAKFFFPDTTQIEPYQTTNDAGESEPVDPNDKENPIALSLATESFLLLPPPTRAAVDPDGDLSFASLMAALTSYHNPPQKRKLLIDVKERRAYIDGVELCNPDAKGTNASPAGLEPQLFLYLWTLAESEHQAFDKPLGDEDSKRYFINWEYLQRSRLALKTERSKEVTASARLRARRGWFVGTFNDETSFLEPAKFWAFAQGIDIDRKGLDQSKVEELRQDRSAFDENFSQLVKVFRLALAADPRVEEYLPVKSKQKSLSPKRWLPANLFDVEIIPYL